MQCMIGCVADNGRFIPFHLRLPLPSLLGRHSNPMCYLSSLAPNLQDPCANTAAMVKVQLGKLKDQSPRMQQASYKEGCLET